MIPPAPFTLAWLGRYLSQRLERDVTPVSLEKFSRGTSRETWFAHYRTDPAAQAVGIILRTDHPAGSVDPTPLDQEHFIYERLGAADLPVARVLWWEASPEWCDRPFYVREMIDGHWNIPGYTDPDPAHDALRIAIAKEHLQALAKIHALDWRALGFAQRLPVPPTPQDAAASCIDGAVSRYAQCAGEPIPIFAEACEWLRDHAPPAPRLCLCKGTNGLGEEVFRDNRLVALSDWEEVSIGDPASDFAFMQNFSDPIERDGQRLWGLEQALAYYATLSPLPIVIESVRYYQIIRALMMLVFSRNAAAISHEHPTRATVRQVWTGTEVLHIAKHLLASAMGLLPPLPPECFTQLNESVETLQ